MDIVYTLNRACVCIQTDEDRNKNFLFSHFPKKTASQHGGDADDHKYTRETQDLKSSLWEDYKAEWK